jgi:hypothetical protein
VGMLGIQLSSGGCWRCYAPINQSFIVVDYVSVVVVYIRRIVSRRLFYLFWSVGVKYLPASITRQIPSNNLHMMKQYIWWTKNAI